MDCNDDDATACIDTTGKSFSFQLLQIFVLVCAL